MTKEKFERCRELDLQLRTLTEILAAIERITTLLDPDTHHDYDDLNKYLVRMFSLASHHFPEIMAKTLLGLNAAIVKEKLKTEIEFDNL